MTALKKKSLHRSIADAKEEAPAAWHICGMLAVHDCIDGERCPVRPAWTWINGVLKRCHTQLRGVAMLMEDRIECRRFVASPRGPR